MALDNAKRLTAIRFNDVPNYVSRQEYDERMHKLASIVTMLQVRTCWRRVAAPPVVVEPRLASLPRRPRSVVSPDTLWSPLPCVCVCACLLDKSAQRTRHHRTCARGAPCVRTVTHRDHARA